MLLKTTNQSSVKYKSSPCPYNLASVSTKRHCREGVWWNARKEPELLASWYLGAVRRSWSGRRGGRRNAADSPGAPRSSPAPPRRLRRLRLPSRLSAGRRSQSRSSSSAGGQVENLSSYWARNLGHIKMYVLLWAWLWALGVHTATIYFNFIFLISEALCDSAGTWRQYSPAMFTGAGAMDTAHGRVPRRRRSRRGIAWNSNHLPPGDSQTGAFLFYRLMMVSHRAQTIRWNAYLDWIAVTGLIRHLIIRALKNSTCFLSVPCSS
jgi:hypothetical protein